MSNINLLLINLVNFDKNEILTNKKGRQNSNVVSQLLKLALSKIQLNTENKSSYKWTRNGEILGDTVYIRIREYPVKNPVNKSESILCRIGNAWQKFFYMIYRTREYIVE